MPADVVCISKMSFLCKSSLVDWLDLGWEGPRSGEDNDDEDSEDESDDDE